jgi:uncharacterized protein involved in exopolysaccharide biosynthesis
MEPTTQSSEIWPTVSIRDFFQLLRRRRRLLFIFCGIGTAFAIFVAFTRPYAYESTARLMPPGSQSLSTQSLLGALAGSGALPSSLTGGGQQAATFIGILRSRTAQNDIIRRANLQTIYKCKLLVDCRGILEANTKISQDEGSGFISISVIDSDPNRARDVVSDYVEELSKLVNNSSTSSARSERIFLEQRLASIKDDLDATSKILSQFSSKNATLNPQAQGQSLIEEASRLQGQLVTAESELSALRAQYADGSVQVRMAHARVDELQAQLNKMGGTAATDTGKTGEFYPSIRQLPLLGVTYADLSRRLAIQEGLYEALTKEYELAKVEEAKEIPPVKVLDEADVPERRMALHRLVITALGFFLSGFIGVMWLGVTEAKTFIKFD